MEKSLHTPEHAALVELLRETRHSAGVTQIELAALVGEPQSFISKWERGALRLDVIQLRTLCQALGVSFETFIRRFERRLKQKLE